MRLYPTKQKKKKIRYILVARNVCLWGDLIFKTHRSFLDNKLMNTLMKKYGFLFDFL